MKTIEVMLRAAKELYPVKRHDLKNLRRIITAAVPGIVNQEVPEREVPIRKEEYKKALIAMHILDKMDPNFAPAMDAKVARRNATN